MLLNVGEERLDFKTNRERFSSFLAGADPVGFTPLMAPGGRATLSAFEGAETALTYLSPVAQLVELSARRGSHSVGFRRKLLILRDGHQLCRHFQEYTVFDMHEELRCIDIKLNFSAPTPRKVTLEPDELGTLLFKLASAMITASTGQLRDTHGDVDGDQRSRSSGWISATGVVGAETVALGMLVHQQNPPGFEWSLKRDRVLLKQNMTLTVPMSGITLGYRFMVRLGYAGAPWFQSRYLEYGATAL